MRYGAGTVGQSPNTETPEGERDRETRRHPLGLPAGSVRALLTLLVVGFIIGQTFRGVAVKLLWTETLMIVLAHYFTSRRFVNLSDELRRELEAAGEIEEDAQPLYLPRHSIRTLIIAGFAGLAWFLWREGRLFDDQSIAILGTVGAYLLGIVFRAIIGLVFQGDTPPPNWYTDGKAILTIAIVATTVAVQLAGAGPLLPFPVEHLENVTMGLVLFYFGSR